jgi:rfaE bifunctional protein kinase chain/domain
MNSQELRQILSDITQVRIGVVGDFCLDAYWTLDASLSEISIETGVATRPVTAQRYSLGGAGNVVANLASLGVKRVSAYGVIGADPFGREMQSILSKCGAEAQGMLVQDAGWDTPVYAKPVEGDAELGRIDFGNGNALAPEIAAMLVDVLRAALPDLDALVINQQVSHGVHTDAMRSEITSLILGSRIPVLCDSRSLSDSYDGAIRKLNEREALRLCGMPVESADSVPLADARRAADSLYKRWMTPVFLTRGARGMLVRDGVGMHSIPGLAIPGRIDAVGAGDSALAGIAAAMAAGRDALTAATLGNLVAGVTVRKLFVTGTATPREIMEIGADPDFIFNPELADDPRAARFYPSSEIEIVTALPRIPRFAHAIFDNDGTLSTLREGWEGIMEPVMIRAILGGGWMAADERLFRRVRDRVQSYIDMTTGVQTLAQMHGLVDMVKEFAVVPAAEVRDAKGYKELYNHELLAMVGSRVTKLERGELCVEDFTVKGALPLLRALHAAGVRLHLTSGTDECDVVAEARALGYHDLFEGRIHGAVGDMKVEAKKIILEEILADIGTEGGPAVITFGDGPVEIRETRRRGGYAVGVASDELRRFGWNMRKRARVIRAGADLVVPDFSQWKSLLEVLGIHA